MAKPASRQPAANWKEIFVATLAKSPNVSAAAKKANINRQYAYVERGRDDDFAAAWDSALEVAVDDAEAEMWRRAVNGTLKPVFHQGKKCGSVREYSDTLLIFALKAHKPEVYRETVRNDNRNFDIDISKLTDEQLNRLASGEDILQVLKSG